MKKSRFSEEQIVGTLKEAEAGVPVADLCRKAGISDVTFYRWKAKDGGLEVNDARRLKQIVAEQTLDIQALKMVLGKSGEARRTACNFR